MKRKLIIFALLLIMILPLRIHAADKYYGVSCKYDMNCYNDDNTLSYVGTYTIIYSNSSYNPSNNKYSNRDSYHLIYSDGSKTDVITKEAGVTSLNSNIKNFKDNDKFHNSVGDSVHIYFKSDDANGNTFAALSKASNDNPCPKLHCAFTKNGNAIYINPGNIHKDIEEYGGDGGDIKDYTRSAKEILVCKNDNDKERCGVLNGELKKGEWKPFDKNSQGSGGSGSSNKDSQICEYSLTPLGQKGESGLQATSPDETVDVTLTTNYDEDGSPLSYYIKVNDNENLVNINKDFDTTFRGKSDYITYAFTARSETMKLLFTDTCLDQQSVFLYLTKRDSARANYVITTSMNEAKTNMIDIDENGNVTGKGAIKLKELTISDKPMSCQDLLKEPLLSIIKGSLTIIQIVAAIITIVRGMMLFIPAVIAKDADALKKASKQLAVLGVLLALVIIFRPLVVIIGKLLEYDISCII